ncbi:MAG: NUDIX hydrolase [bacterium]|nr:NUDIX hydrolase [bacterium]
MLYDYCPKCGGKYTLDEGENKLQCRKCSFVLYRNSKPTASVLILDKGRLLLGRRRIEPSKGKWDVIEGFLNNGEHPVDGAIREVREETGLEVDPYELLGFFMDVYGPTKEPTLNICFIGKRIKGELRPGDDIEKLKWFKRDEIPRDIAFQNGKDMIEAWLQKSLK